jgi:hypothetical protein
MTAKITRLRRMALVLGICAVAANAPAPAQNSQLIAQNESGGANPAPSSPGPTMLKAGIEHSESVQPLDPQLMPGQRFNPSAVAMGAPVDEWICIPPWIAGTFYVDKSLIVQFVDYRTQTQLMPNRMEKIYRTFHYGHQLDSNGRVWHLNRCPYRNSIETEQSVQYNLIRKSRFLHSGNDSIVETATGPALVVSKGTGVIARSTTIETFGRFEPDGNSVRKTTSIKGFNPAGMPEDLIVRVEKAMMLEPFAPDPSTAESFARFMAQRQAQKQQQMQYQQYQQYQQQMQQQPPPQQQFQNRQQPTQQPYQGYSNQPPGN